jgi:hypothetical protein
MLAPFVKCPETFALASKETTRADPPSATLDTATASSGKYNPMPVTTEVAVTNIHPIRFAGITILLSTSNYLRRAQFLVSISRYVLIDNCGATSAFSSSQALEIRFAGTQRAIFWTFWSKELGHAPIKVRLRLKD